MWGEMIGGVGVDEEEALAGLLPHSSRCECLTSGDEALTDE